MTDNIFDLDLRNKSKQFLISLVDLLDEEIEELKNEIIKLKDEPRTKMVSSED